jgi:hypothetical protein
MSFATLSVGWVLAGLAGLAAGLFALQQLRTRYRDVTVVTTIFWKQVVDEAPVRKFRERFRHPLAYALILAIASLIWLSFADPQFAASNDGTFHIAVLDGSAGMAAGNRFDRAVSDLERYVSGLPADRRQVIWSGAELRSVLLPGEHDLLLQKRLARLAPEPAPASVERAIRQLSASPRAGQQTDVVVFGDAPVRKQVLDLLPNSITVTRASAADATLKGNGGITALGVSDAQSGAWDRVDVLIDVQRVAGAKPGDVQLALDGQPVPTSAITRTGSGDDQHLFVRDMPAAGGLFSAKITGGADDLSLDDTASVRLPDKPILKVQLSASLERDLGPVLRADSGVALVTSAPQIVVRKSGEAIGGTAPALEFVPSASQPQAFVLTHPDTLDSNAVLADAVDRIGLTQIDAMALAQESGRLIEALINTGAQWRVSVWADLLSEQYNFTRSRAFPLFVANALRWLAGTPAWYPSVGAGRPLVAASVGSAVRVVAPNGRVIDPLGTAFIPPRAGDLAVAANGRTLAVSLIDPAVTSGVHDAALPTAAASPTGGGSGAGVATWLGVLALILLAVEWHFFQRGRLP